MPLKYADFAHHYEGQGLSELQQREHFDVMAKLLECIVRLFWQEDAPANGLGITFDADALRLGDAVQSENTTTSTFNVAVSGQEAAKRDS